VTGASRPVFDDPHAASLRGLAILGGLFISTVLNLLFLPTLARHFGRFEASDAPAEKFQ
jgi:hypothetical protein